MRMFFYTTGDGIQWDRLGYDGILVNNYQRTGERWPRCKRYQQITDSLAISFVARDLNIHSHLLTSIDEI